MTNRKNLKTIIHNDFDKNKNYERIIETIERGNKIKNMNFKYALLSVCAVFAIGIVIASMNFYKSYQPIIKENDKTIYVNKLKNENQTSLDADIRKIDGKIQDEINKNFDFLSNLAIPNGLTKTNEYTIYTRANKDANYDILHDYVLEYAIFDGELQTKQILITFSENYEPLRDYYFGEENVKKSMIHNTELEIFSFEKNYMAKFTYHNVNFDIETYQITLEEFIALLESIIK